MVLHSTGHIAQPLDFYLWGHMKDLMYHQKMETYTLRSQLHSDGSLKSCKRCTAVSDFDVIIHIKEYVFMRF